MTHFFIGLAVCLVTFPLEQLLKYKKLRFKVDCCVFSLHWKPENRLCLGNV